MLLVVRMAQTGFLREEEEEAAAAAAEEEAEAEVQKKGDDFLVRGQEAERARVRLRATGRRLRVRFAFALINVLCTKYVCTKYVNCVCSKHVNCVCSKYVNCVLCAHSVYRLHDVHTCSTCIHVYMCIYEREAVGDWGRRGGVKWGSWFVHTVMVSGTDAGVGGCAKCRGDRALGWRSEGCGVYLSLRGSACDQLFTRPLTSWFLAQFRKAASNKQAMLTARSWCCTGTFMKLTA